ncbi:MAG: hypothetical protein FVQ80_07165 [Planctomycetes bacterium]|nr:hypothetical protein [Planctomycetota bacterium]
MENFKIKFQVDEGDKVYDAKVILDQEYDYMFLMVEVGNVVDEDGDEEDLSFYMDCEDVDVDEVVKKLKEKDRIFTWEVLEDEIGFYHNTPGA